MKHKLLIIFAFSVLGAILIGLNMASYTQKPKEIDNESNPNRSSYNSGATGTQAYYALLSETGRNVVRWQEPLDALANAGKHKPTVFVVIGALRRQFTEADVNNLLYWVEDGGQLVLIDRAPPLDLVQTTSGWALDVKDIGIFDLPKVDTADRSAMTKNVVASLPAQPTTISAGVNSIQPSIFAGDIDLSRKTRREEPEDYSVEDEYNIPPSHSSDSDIKTPSMPASNKRSAPGSNTGKGSHIKGSHMTETGDAPVVHFASGDKNIVVDAPYGKGKIIFLSDPYIVSNGGISLVDNAQLAINLVAVHEGIIAFDEYHQGFGSNNNRFVQFFSGTPVISIFFQCMALVGLIFYSQSRRFARPISVLEQDRLSKLEYVSAMAEMQQRTRSFDLAVENIYRDFRRKASRLLGLDNRLTSISILALAISERTGFDRNVVEKTLDHCEQIIFGEPTNQREVLTLAKQIRDLENALGLSRRPRN